MHLEAPVIAVPEPPDVLKVTAVEVKSVTCLSQNSVAVLAAVLAPFYH